MSTNKRSLDALAERGKIDKALAAYETIVEKDPADYDAWRRIAELYEDQAAARWEKDKKDEATRGFEKAAEVYASHGWFGQALRVYQSLSKISPSHPGLDAKVRAVRKTRIRVLSTSIGLPLLSALLFVLAIPPLNIWPAALVALVPLLIAIRSTSMGRAAVMGWVAGWAVNLLGFWWGTDLLVRFGDLSTPTSLLTNLVLSAYQGGVWMLWAAIISHLCNRRRLPWLVVAPLTLIVLEALIPMVFPWYLALGASSTWPLLQVAELGGPTAVSGLLVLINLFVLEAGLLGLKRGGDARALKWGAATIVVILLGGLARASQVASVRASAPGLKVAVIQPNFGTMSLELRKSRGQDYLRTLRRATNEAAEQGAELVLWPESMFPFLFDRQLKKEFPTGHPWELRPGYDGRLLFGALTHPFGESEIYNSAILLSGSGDVSGIYDKTDLLVFGEYIPFAERFPKWAKEMRRRLPDWPDVTAGPGPAIISDGALRIAPLICYEDILPNHVARAALLKPNLLVSLANHAWFGDSAAPYEAAGLATLRSVETRRDLVRATNTGSSTFSDALGRIWLRGSVHDVDPAKPVDPEVLVSEVKLVEMFALGPYSVPWFPWISGGVLAMVVLWGRRRGKKNEA